MAKIKTKVLEKTLLYYLLIIVLFIILLIINITKRPRRSNNHISLHKICLLFLTKNCLISKRLFTIQKQKTN